MRSALLNFVRNRFQASVASENRNDAAPTAARNAPDPPAWIQPSQPQPSHGRDHTHIEKDGHTHPAQVWEKSAEQEHTWQKSQQEQPPGKANAPDQKCPNQEEMCNEEAPQPVQEAVLGKHQEDVPRQSEDKRDQHEHRVG